ncbi:hypothetical protein BGY98DRAFT_273842 [Russula aff. rugulosa BPL654]|nr:hypothetical protein BGY98DRAFT_273842 [Russula aff. rugulosa BPL654]
MPLSLIMLIYAHSEALCVVGRLARAGSTLCPTVNLSFGSVRKKQGSFLALSCVSLTQVFSILTMLVRGSLCPFSNALNSVSKSKFLMISEAGLARQASQSIAYCRNGKDTFPNDKYSTVRDNGLLYST